MLWRVGGVIMEFADKEFWRCPKCQKRVLITSNAKTIKYRLEETEKEHDKKCKWFWAF